MPRTSITGVVNDRIRPYFVVLLDARITTVSRRVVYDHRFTSFFFVYGRMRSQILNLGGNVKINRRPSESLSIKVMESSEND
jgi:hypothetical protein